MDTAGYSHFLSHLPVFKGLTQDQIVEVARLLKVVRLRPGDTLCTEGEQGDCVFLLEAGQVEVLKSTASGDLQVLATVPAPSVIGEMTLIDGAPRSATVRATGGVTLYRIDCSDFNALRSSFSPAAYRVIRNLGLMLCERLRETNERVNVLRTAPGGPEEAVRQQRRS